MIKRYGSPIRQDGLVQVGRRRWDLFYGFGKDSEDAESGYNYYETFDHKPSTEEVRAIIVSQINANTEEKIVSGFTWNDIPVWLSQENQFNYKSAYDLAVQTLGKTLPVTFKFGDDNNPQYYTFDNLTELGSFVEAVFVHISTTLSDGWKEKDSLDIATIMGN
jgi:hypothetical protein